MAGKWVFNEHGSWIPFDPVGEQAVETAHVAGHSSAQSSFFNPRLQQNIVYHYDLTKMQQINTATNFTRPIKRDDNCNPEGGGIMGLGDPFGGAARGGAKGGHHHHHKRRNPSGGQHRETIEYKVPLGGATQAHDFATVTAYKVLPVSSLGEGDMCSICQCDFQNECDDANEVCIQLSKCTGHYFHRSCVDNEHCFKQGFIKCPVCKTSYGMELGSAQPSGTMTIHLTENACDGHSDCGTWQIDYSFSSGIQAPSMPSPGAAYSGTHRTAYLPDNTEALQVLQLLKIAFGRGLTFAVGQSVTTGQQNTTVWNGIHHKTNLSGGSSHFGYPDASYFQRVKDELALKGVTPPSHTQLPGLTEASSQPGHSHSCQVL